MNGMTSGDRAGQRDGGQVKCILFWARVDIYAQRNNQRKVLIRHLKVIQPMELFLCNLFLAQVNVIEFKSEKSELKLRKGDFPSN